MSSQGKGYGPIAFIIGTVFWLIAFGWYGLLALLGGSAL